MLKIQTILHPTDFSEQSHYALHLAQALARDHGARIVVLHVASRPAIAYGEGVFPLDPTEWLETARKELAALALPEGTERRLAEGDPADETVRIADEIKADMIVMGTHGRNWLGRMFMGSVAEQVVRRAHCPVLTTSLPYAPAEEMEKQQPVAAGVEI